MKFTSTLVLIFFSLSAYSTTITWDGGVSSNWSEPDNWIPRGLPGDGDSVFIFGDNVVMDISDDIDWLHLTNATLTINAGKSLTLITNVQYTNELLMIGQSRMYNHGSIFVESGTNKSVYLKEGSAIHNYGILEVIESNDEGIEIRDSSQMVNHGMITVKSCLNRSMTNWGLFHNLGHLIIDNISSIGTDVVGYSANGETINDGKITISNITRGISNRGGFINNDTMIFSDIHRTAFSESDSTTNYGVILISDCPRNGIQVSSDGEFINSGKITMENIASDNLGSCGSFINLDTLIIINSGNVGILLDDNGTFTNDKNGFIDIVSSFQGIENYDTFINNGKIKIANTTLIALRNEGTFENNKDSQLSITTSQSDGIYNEGIFNCADASIVITMVTRHGINNRVGIIDVDPFSHIVMSNIGQNPLINEDGAVLTIHGMISFSN